jgi:hypothetical protein
MNHHTMEPAGGGARSGRSLAAVLAAVVLTAACGDGAELKEMRGEAIAYC